MAKRSKKPPTPQAELARITKEIKAFEQRSIDSIVEIGKLLHEAAQPEICSHGEYQDWLKREFGWSYQTSLNYRNVYQLVEYPPDHPHKPNSWVFGSINDLDISLSALYLIAAMKDDDQQAARFAIIEAAKVGRVTYKIARDIIRKSEEEERERVSASLNITSAEPAAPLPSIPITSEARGTRSSLITPSPGSRLRFDPDGKLEMIEDPVFEDNPEAGPEPAEKTPAPKYCNFCGKSSQLVDTMIASSLRRVPSFICNECIDASNGIITERKAGISSLPERSRRDVAAGLMQEMISLSIDANDMSAIIPDLGVEWVKGFANALLITCEEYESKEEETAKIVAEATAESAAEVAAAASRDKKWMH